MSVDPTAIPLLEDPLRRRFRGVAVHGNTYFDVPYITHVRGNLYQGGCRSGLRLPLYVDHVVSLYPWEQYNVSHELQSELKVRLFDSDDEIDIAEWLGIAGWVYRCMKMGPTLVHCQAGLNRSGLVAGLALVMDGMKPQEALDLLRETRSPAVLCNKTFERALLECP